MKNLINNKNFHRILIIVILVLLLIIIFFAYRNNKSESIGEVAELWNIYDLNVNKIKNNLDEIIEPSENAVCGNLKGIEIIQNGYSMALNEVACSIITYYYGLIEFDEQYHNRLLKYRDWSRISIIEVKNLKWRLTTDGSYIHDEFRLMKNHYYIDENVEIKDLFKETNTFLEKYDTDFYKQEDLSYKEIITHKMAEISHVAYLSDWLKEAYYSYIK